MVFLFFVWGQCYFFFLWEESGSWPVAQGLFVIRVRWNSTQSRSKWLLKKAPQNNHLHVTSPRHLPACNIKSLSTGPLRRKRGSKVVELCFQFALHGWPYEIKNWMWLWYQLQTHVRDALMFSGSQSVYHVNVIGDWKLVELGWALLSVKCLLGAVMCLCVRVRVRACLCVPAQLHTFIVTAMCILCRLVCVWLHVLELHIRYQITFVSRDLAFLRGCQPAVTACMSRESSMCSIIPNLILEPDGSHHRAFGFRFVRIQTR